jgi:hypothetical protein
MTMQHTTPAPAVASPNQQTTIAWILVAIQAALVGLAGLFLWTWNADGRRRFVHRFFHDQMATHPMRWGLALMILSGALVIVAVALARRRSWAPPAVYVLETILALGALVRFHPVRSLVGLGLAIAVIVIVANDTVASSANKTE